PTLLWHELEASKLVLTNPRRYEEGRAEISRRGAIEWGQVRSIMGEATGRGALSQLGRPYPEDDCIRILGFGHALTEFALKPLCLPYAEQQPVLRLGAMANLIVATYDQLVDLSGGPRKLLPQGTLDMAAHDRGRRLVRGMALVSPAPSRMMLRLVAGYFEGIERLACTRNHAHVPQVRNCLGRAIKMMYEAEELVCAQGEAICSEQILRRKGALPFLVMGLPAWLVVPSLHLEHYLWHLHWLYRLGEFFGWIDDTVDLEADRASGQPNRLARLRTAPWPGTGRDADIARMIARKGQRILAEWRRRAGDAGNKRIPLADTETFSICLASWFGGVPR
ncbi:MAG TPA: hypothetical protein VEW94_01575, partial [Chloroflexia bacterium]|nr:hypothetical protein [Chloroflexia bacterium]